MSTELAGPDAEAPPRGAGTISFALLLTGFVGVCFPQVLAGLKTFVYRDFGLYGLPLAYHWHESFWSGELPLWNPYSNCGLPFLAQWNTMVLYPLSLIYAVLPLPWSLNFFCLLHLVLAGVGMHVLARRWTGSSLGAAVAGTSFAFGGIALCSLMWPCIVAALGWMPWVVLATTRTFQDGWRSVVTAALAGTMQMLTGAPEVILFTWILVAGFFVVEIMRSQARAAMAGRFAAVVLLVAGLSAAQLLPFLELLSESHRDSNYGSRWSMPLWGIANLVVPLFRMVRLNSGVYLQEEQGWTSSYYSGIGALAMAVAAVLWVRDARVWVLAVVAVGGLILALGDAGLLYSAVRKLLPFVGTMRYPVKFVICATFAISLLAAFGIAQVKQLKGGRRLIGIVAMALLCIIGILMVAYYRPVPNVEPSTTLWSGITRALFLVGIVGGIHWYEKQTLPFRRNAVAVGVIILAWLDGYTHVPPQNPIVDNAVFAPQLLSAQPITPQPKLGEARAMLSLGILDAFATNRPSSQADNMIVSRLWQYENLNLLERIPKIDGFFPLYLARERVVHFRMYGSDGLPRPGLGDFLGVSQVAKSTGEKSFGWAFRESHLPLATLHANPAFLEAAPTLTNLMRSTFDSRQTVFLPVEAQPVIRATNGHIGRIISRTASANRIAVETETPGPNLLVVAQMHYPGWAAYVDGRKVPIHRANFGFQALEVPAGRHQCELRYQDNRFRLGLGMSVLSACACAGLWFWAGRPRA